MRYDFRNTVARIIVAAASTEDVKRRTSLSALLSDIKTRFAWMNQLERFSGNLKYHKENEDKPHFNPECVGPANPFISPKIGVPFMLVSWHSMTQFRGKITWNIQAITPLLRKMRYHLMIEKKISVPVQGAGGWAERGLYR